MATFTQRHYTRIAETISAFIGNDDDKANLALLPPIERAVCEAMIEHIRTELCTGFANMFSEDNRRFKPHLFYAACGAMDLWRQSKPTPTPRARRQAKQRS